MFVFDPLTQGLQLLAKRDLQQAESLFLRVINDPYVQSDELSRARSYLDDIRSCQSGVKILDFERYGRLCRNQAVSLEPIYELLREVYASPARTYGDIDRAIAEALPTVINRIRPLKIQDVQARDTLFRKIEKNGLRALKKDLKDHRTNGSGEEVDAFRWKTIVRKFLEAINPVLLERHLELLSYILETGEIGILEDPKLTALTPKYRWIIEATLKAKWYLMRSYFFKARSEIQNQFHKKEGTRKYWEEVKYRKIRIFEECGFQEKHIQKFLFADKLNYPALEEIHRFSRDQGLTLVPRDVSLALRGVDKAKANIRERAGYLTGVRKEFQDRLQELGFSREDSYRIARHAKKTNSRKIAESFERCLKIAAEEIYWYRVPPQSGELRQLIQEQCLKHLSTVRIHLFDRGRLNKFLLQTGKPMIRDYLVRLYGEKVLDLHCYFRLETIHQFYKLKYFQYHAPVLPSVSELIKISRRDCRPLLEEAYRGFVKKKRLDVPDEVFQEVANHRSEIFWEDPCTTAEEKILLRFWFLMDHGVPITQGLINKGVLRPGFDLVEFLKIQEPSCKS